MHRFRFGLILACMLGFPLWAAAQGNITGTVTDANSGESLPGVNVIIPRLSIGAGTDIDGRYEIFRIPAGTYDVEATFIGYGKQTKSVTIESGETATIDFALNSSALRLDEVVVTGSGGAVEKKRLGNSIATLDMQALQSAPITSFSDILQGREAGITGLPSGGLAGEGTRIRIRGSATLSVSNEPIVYIDGIRVDNSGGFGPNAGFVGTGGGGSPSRLDDINPDAITRVEVLKGAAAATLYGTEASNGVIQIFTKQGQIGRPKFDFTVQQGFSAFPENIPNNAGFAQIIGDESAEQVAARMNRVYGTNLQPYEVYDEENFTHDLFSPGYKQVYSGAISGGSPGISYFVSGRFMNEDGPFGDSDSDRYDAPGYVEGTKALSEDLNRLAQLSASLSAVPADNVRFRLSTYYTDRLLRTFENNNNIYGLGSLAMFGKPEYSCANAEDCAVVFSPGVQRNIQGTRAFATVNEALLQSVEQEVVHFFGSFNVAYTAIDQGDRRVGFESNFGFDVANIFSTDLRPFGWDIDGFTAASVQGRSQFSDSNSNEFTFDGRATWDDNLGGIESNLIAGFQVNLSRFFNESGQGEIFPGPGLEIVSGAVNQGNFQFIQEVVNAGVFGQLQLGLTEWTFATLGARYDANSAFGDEFNGQFYPKVGLSVIPSDAPFWNGLGPISSLVVKAAIGRSGLQPGAFSALTTFVGIGGGIFPNNLGNPDLKPEVSTEFEIGTEFGLFSDRFGVEATYWNRTVTDALVSQQFPVSGGFRATQLVNIGQLDAQGVEVAVDAIAYSQGDVALNVFANASYIWEQVTDLGGAPPIKVGGSYPRYRNYLVEGYAPGTNFGAALIDVDDGFLPVDFNGDGSPDSRQELLDMFAAADYCGSTDQGVSCPGLPSSTNIVLLKQEGGNPDISPPLNQFLGKPQPDWSGSFGFQLDVGSFSVNSLLEYRTGNYYVNNLTDAFRQANATIGKNLPTSARVDADYINPASSPEVRLGALEGWLYENLALAPFSGLNTIEKADFLRLRELGLTFNLPRETVRGLGLRNASLTLAGRNLFLITPYGGVDPETNAVGRGSGNQLDENFLDSVEAFGYPLARSVLFTVRFGF